MPEKLTKLYNTMLLIETKGESTKLMADCLRYLGSLINEVNQQAREAASAPEAEPVES